MNPEHLRKELPEPVRRYFEEVARMEPPIDLMDGAISEIEMQPAVNRFSSLPVIAALAATAALFAAIVAGAGLLGRDQPGNVPVPSASHAAPTPTLVPGALIPQELQGRFYGTDASEAGGGGTGSIEFTATTFRYIDQYGATHFRSAASLLGPGEIRLIADNPDDCANHSATVGTYRYSLSADGRALTVAANLEDPCGGRSFRAAGYWERRN
jgi:hypothetical protein